MTKYSYQEGDVFTIGLAEDKYRIGLVARRSERGPSVLGYFSKQTYAAPPQLSDIDFSIENFFPLMFGDPYLLNKRWVVIGQIEPWSRAAWPMPEFVRIDPIKHIARIVIYDENNPLIEVGTRRCNSDPAMYPRAVSYDAKAVESYLNSNRAPTP